MANNRNLPYQIVDVFTQHPLEGNALAVFTEASTLDTDTMQRIAREMNLAESAFILPATRSDCAARVRIFTPSKEMKFAGHPTVGTGFVLRREGIVPVSAKAFALEEIIGRVPLRVDSDDQTLLWLTTPPLRSGATYERALCAGALGLETSDLLDTPPQWLSAGNPTLFIALRSREAVDRAWLDLTGAKRLRRSQAEPFCVFVFSPTQTGAYSRMFAPEFGVPEDAATGSATGPLAAYMMQHGLISGAASTRFVSEQGTQMGRRSLLHVLIRGEGGAEGIDVGGHVTPIASGMMHLHA